MESRWYVPAGKILSETKIEDRTHALHITKDNWKKLTGHLDRNRLALEAKEAEEQKKRIMKETSEEMKKGWNVMIEDKEELIRLQDDKLAKNVERFMQLKKDQEEDRNIYVAQMREKMFQKKDYPKALTSALLLSDVVYERGKQMELKKMIEEKSKLRDFKYDQQVKEGSLKAMRTEDEKAAKEIAKNKEYARQLIEQRNAMEAERKREAEEKKQAELLDCEFLKEETKDIEDVLKRKQLEKERRVKSDLLLNMQLKKEKKERIKEEDRQVDEVVGIIDKYRKRIDCIMKQKEQERIHLKARIAEESGAQIRAREDEKLRQEEEQRKRVIEERQAMEDEREQQRIERQKRMREELIAAHKEDLEKKNKELADETEIKKLEMLNRFKLTEETKVYEENMKKKQIEDLTEYIKSWDEKRSKNEEIKHKQIQIAQEEVAVYEERKARDDEDFYRYAGEVEKMARDRGRITYPIKKVVAHYEKNVLNLPPKATKCRRHNPESEVLINSAPGRRAHDPRTDPNYRRCKCTCHCDVISK